jgi:hypothetical protein
MNPARFCCCFRFLAGRYTVEVTVRIAGRRRWAASAESRSPLWLSRPLGRFVVALALDVVDPAPAPEGRTAMPGGVPSLN